mmetsp:Transcript_28151/g.82732  ORF Transcript_28151/g.82732 Transcript_28151/m.82732 type:complete len:299 (-) Transcript_28151:326-1222(-)
MHPAVLAACLAAWGGNVASFAHSSADLRNRYVARSAFREPVRAAAAASSQQYDDLIRQMRATSTQQLPQLVAANLQSIDTQFFLRLAELVDATDDRLEKARLSQLADTVAKTIQQALEKTDAVADAKSAQAQELIAMLADDNGEFVTPVPEEKLAALRERVRQSLPQLDETFVATVRAFLKKCADDNLDGMVVVLQKVLQVFAAEVLVTMTRGLRDDLREATHALLLADADRWGEVLSERMASGDVSADEIAQVLREEVAQVVLELPSGSLTQSVVAEYLGEAIKRVDEVGAAHADSE